MVKRIPEKYINGGMLIGFIILMGIIGYVFGTAPNGNVVRRIGKIPNLF